MVMSNKKLRPDLEESFDFEGLRNNYHRCFVELNILYPLNILDLLESQILRILVGSIRATSAIELCPIEG